MASGSCGVGLAGWQEGGARLWLPFFLMLEAEGHAKANRQDTALKTIEEALAICKETGERWALAELLRVKARLLNALRLADANKIEAILVNSLKIARSQQACCWELRTSCDLARLWCSQGRAKEGLKLLQAIYDRFGEGFDTTDLREARVLIENLRSKRPRRVPEN